jgi:hypothetical protein
MVGKRGRGYPTWTIGHDWKPTGRRKKTVRVSRMMYEMYVGGIDDSMELDHLCKTPLCVNPSHLEPVSHKENMRRWASTIVPKTHCKHGHEYAVTGFYQLGPPYNERRCKVCYQERHRQWKQKMVRR